MNSSYGKSSSKAGSINAFDFDLGLGSGQGKPLNDRKTQTTTTSSYSSAPSWNPQPNKPAWTHSPAPASASASALSGGPGSLSGPTSMVGDIFGKTWNSAAPSNSGIGIVNSNNPNLFGDLLSSAMGQNKTSSNVPLKNAAPVPAASQNKFSMGSMADSLPKTGNTGRNTGTWGANVSNVGGSANSSGNYNKGSGIGGGSVTLGGNRNRSPNLGGPAMKSMAGSGVGGSGMGSSQDPFGSLVDFRSKPVGSMNSASKQSDKSGLGNDPFQDFQSNIPKANTSNTKFSSGISSASNNDPFGNFEFPSSHNKSNGLTSGFPSGASPASNNDPLGDFGFASTQPTNETRPPVQPSGADPLGDFGFPNSQPSNQTQSSVQSSVANDFDALFSSAAGSGTSGAGGFTSQQFSEGDDWGINSEFDGGNDTGGTTELDGLPPPPPGVSAPTAKSKGMDNYKQGQFADAIKWLSWAVLLLEKSGNQDGTMEALTCRASCYKEVGEYKKAVADCTKVLENDGKNVAVLVQRALLYESMEKYKLGAEDLRTVMKIDPGNRVARSTVHRLTKLAEF